MNWVNYKQLNKQKGIALIFVMVIFSLITVLAAKIVTNIRLETERTSHLLMRQQAKQYAYSAEQFIAELLRADQDNDGRNNKKVDHYYESWHRQQEELKIDTGDIGKIEIDVFDLQAFINLNGVTSTGQSGNPTNPNPNPNPSVGGGKGGQGEGKTSDKLLQPLLQLQGIANGQEVINQIVDWIDSDQQTKGTSGAEDDDYLLRAQPYRTANDQMASVSELMLLAKMDYKIYRKLAPFVTVIPGAATATKININTAPVEVIQSLAGNISKQDAENIIKARGKEGFKDYASLKNIQAAQKIKEQDIVYKSDYFKAVIKTKFADAEYYLVSYFHRSPKQGVSVISRQEGQPLIQLAKPKVKKD